MLTLLQAKSLTGGQVIYDQKLNKQAQPWAWKVGRVQEWKKNPGKLVVTVKHGLHTHDILGQHVFRHRSNRLLFCSSLSIESDAQSERSVIEQAAVDNCADPATLAQLADWFDDHDDELVAQELRAAAVDRHLDLIWDHALIRERPRDVPALKMSSLCLQLPHFRAGTSGTWLEGETFLYNPTRRSPRRALARDPLGNLCLCYCDSVEDDETTSMAARLFRSLAWTRQQMSQHGFLHRPENADSPLQFVPHETAV